MQHGHALDTTLNVELAFTLRWLNLGFDPRLSSWVSPLIQERRNGLG